MSVRAGQAQTVVKLDRVRAATTVVAANVCYPTDSGLLAKGVAKLARLTARIKAAGLATRTKTRDHTRSVRKRAHSIGAWLRRRNDDAKQEAKAITGEMATIATQAIVDARHVARNARRGLCHAGAAASAKTAALVVELERSAAALERVAAQTRVRVSGPRGRSEGLVYRHHAASASISAFSNSKSTGARMPNVE